jgi:hypothetical protein
MSKTGKTAKIRYKSVIKKKSVIFEKVKNRFSIDWECSGQFATFGNINR